EMLRGVGGRLGRARLAVFAGVGDDRRIDHMLRLEPTFGVDGRATALACGSDRLTIAMIVHIARDKDTRHVAHGVFYGLEIADLVHIENAPEDLGIGLM